MKHSKIDLKEIERWSKAEGMVEQFRRYGRNSRVEHIPAVVNRKERV